MQQTCGFNLAPNLDGLFTPELWLINLDKNNQPYSLAKRMRRAQLTELDFELPTDLDRLLKLSEELSLEGLDDYFCKPDGKKKPVLSLLWADKVVRPGMEKYIYRKLEQFYSLAEKNKIVLCLDAAKKPILPDYVLRWATEPAQAELQLERDTEMLKYRLLLKNNLTDILLTEVQVLSCSVPAWFGYRNELYKLPAINGKMLLPFKTKDVIEVSRAHEATWFRSFLKKNLEGSVEVSATGFELVLHETLQSSQLQIFKHLFQDAYLLSLHYKYAGAEFYHGEQNQVRSGINIPENSEGEVRIIRIKRDAKAEAAVCEILVAAGLVSDGQNFKLPDSVSLKSLSDWLHMHQAELFNKGIHFVLVEPVSGAAIVTEQPEMLVDAYGEKDWFDTRIMVKLGETRLPFKAFAGHIRNRKTEYTLSDGRVFLIPENWFTRYAELADLMLAQYTDTDTIRIGKLQKEILQSIDLEQVTKRETSKPAPLTGVWQGQNMLQAQLRGYQSTGVDWMLSVLSEGHGACLADDMGLGKTLQTIAVLVHAKQVLVSEQAALIGAAIQLDLFAPKAETHQPLRALIVVPASLVFNWQNELRRFAPHLFVYAHMGPKRLTDQRAMAAHDVVITTYHTNREDAELLRSIDWQFVVLDESQNIKNRSADISQAVFKLPAQRRIALSGTPVENSLADLWSLMHFLNPSLLGSYTAFQKMYQNQIEKDKNTETKARLSERIKPFVLRRRKQEVAPELPELSRQVQLVPMSDAQAELYEKTKSAARNALLKIGQESEFKFAALQALMKLRQIACHPALAGSNDLGASGKFSATLELWQSVIDQQSKVLVFSSFEQHLMLYRAHFEAQKIPFAWISGSTATTDRQHEVERFQNQPEVQTFFITLKSGGTGLNLTAADYVFILDPWWNPQAEEQAIARAHRIGQLKPVHAIRMISQGSIEEKILQLQAEKQELGAGLIDDEMPVMSMEQMRSLFG
jgi:SNF2-related domain/Helicase conserved C-terminal domain/Bacterial SNF2 helicase associated